jgi:hypothetical protein
MSCFTQPVQSVSTAKSFARSGKGGRQFLVYQIQLSTANDVGLILSLPTPPKGMKEDVRFLKLEGQATFFDDLEKAFPQPKSGPLQAGPAKRAEVTPATAAFLPSMAAFEDEDESFRPPRAWAILPQHETSGFVLLKLKKGQNQTYFAAFDFPRKKPTELYLPTYHWHPGKNPDVAAFDHWLYAQVSSTNRESMMDWRESRRPASNYIDAEKTQGIVDPEGHLYTRSLLTGDPNRDTIVS